VGEEDIEKKFGSAIKKWREKIRISQDELARRAGLHRTYICDIERGSRNVSLKNVQKLADGLAISLATLFGSLAGKPAAAPLTTDEQVDLLIVEDSPEDVTLMLNALKTGGITNRTYIVHDGVAALDFLFASGTFAHRRPDDLPRVILLDLHLPKIGGLDFLRRVKADPRTNSIPVIVLTGSKDSADITECKRLGVENYIVKPLSFQSFSEVSLRLNLQWVLSPVAKS
jgi:two-component system response regulator